MGANLGDWSAHVHCTIQSYDIMIADTSEPSLSVPQVNLIDRHITSFRRSRAMHYYLVNSSHRNLFSGRLFLLSSFLFTSSTLPSMYDFTPKTLPA